MAMRRCIDCPTLVPSGVGRCLPCNRKHEQGRGTSTQRGYGSAHQRERTKYQRRMNKGETFTCWRCGTPINPDHWTLGHCDTDRTRYHGPECPPCDYAVVGRTTCPHPSHTST